MPTAVQYVFGLSIDEEIAWAIAEVDTRQNRQGVQAYPPRHAIKYQKIADLPNDWSSEPGFPLFDTIVNSVREARARKDLAPLFSKVVSVGISTIGVTNHADGYLINIHRKKIFPKNPGYYIDFNELVRRIFPHLYLPHSLTPVMSVHNDATAKCLAQICWYQSNAGVVTYINVHYGINIGVANAEGPLSVSNLHPEAGHIYPRLHDDDRQFEDDFEKYTGCPAHVFCYEGLASRARVETQWKDDASLILERNALARDIVAYYVAQLCWNVSVVISPKKILIGGSLIEPSLLQEIRTWFSRFNCGEIVRIKGSRDPYIRPEPPPTYIELAKQIPVSINRNFVSEIDGLMGALELARLAARRQGER